MYFSVIIPVFNRPGELRELLSSLCQQSDGDFEVLIVEDGSKIRSDQVVADFEQQLDIHYYFQENTGQGFARNFGMLKAQGEYWVFFDSDCVIPNDYFKLLREVINEKGLDAHGGPDNAMEDFSDFQKAINFSMTSIWTTGGIRGKVADPKKYQARGYNMGFSRKVYERLGGFVDPNQGEDIELSIRIKNAGFNLQLVEEAYVYHKRRSDFGSFLKQSFSFGMNRVNVNRYHPGAIKAVHLMPSGFLLGAVLTLLSFFIIPSLFIVGVFFYGLWTLGVFLDASISNQSLGVGLLAVLCAYGQLFSYGAGMIKALLDNRFKD
ncbi:glycosyltransferase [Echinicola marina]|uniref:glycosyltransferase n=1 Tax=Echinicola marina TaxID=2859768 RepID=UPI001CF6F3FD|nr:glycosyltransferase [Echinicola marina]UCS93405.1 glycosyltransferase [Echinicola marina]